MFLKLSFEKYIQIPTFVAHLNSVVLCLLSAYTLDPLQGSAGEDGWNSGSQSVVPWAEAAFVNSTAC